MFEGFDFTDFWKESSYSTEKYVSDPPTDALIADTPSAGHDAVFPDYRECGRNGEPAVVLINNEAGNRITKLADNFEEFIRMLRPESDFARE